jgi:lipoprotein-releasing system permease protein
MSYSSLIAKRYLRSSHDGFISFISAIGTLGVALGTAALIITLSVLGGFEREITQKVVGFTSHIQIQGYQNQPLADHTRTSRLVGESFDVVTAVAPFVAREALIRSKEGTDGIFLKGVDPLLDISATRNYIVQGKYDLDREQGSLPKLVVGRKLAARLLLDIGDKVVVFGTGRSGDLGRLRVVQFRVSGIYESGMSEYDDIYAFTALSDAQTVFQMGDAVTGYDVLLTDPDSAAAVAPRLQEMLGYPHYVRTMYQTYRNLFSWIELQKEPVPIILGLIIIVATVNIIGTLLMMVLSKTKEIGILSSMGATRWGISRIFLRQGLTIAFRGTLMGNVLAFGLCYWQLTFKVFSLDSDIYFMSSVPIFMKPEYFLMVSGVSIVLCILSSFIPARLAAKVDPVTAIRFV